MMKIAEWNTSSAQDGEHLSYWRIDPNNPFLHWHVGYHRAHEIGSVAGQILENDGWYWFTSSAAETRYSSMFGPFSSATAATADCEVVNRRMER